MYKFHVILTLIFPVVNADSESGKHLDLKGQGDCLIVGLFKHSPALKCTPYVAWNNRMELNWTNVDPWKDWRI
jgi:hypothetical protein